MVPQLRFNIPCIYKSSVLDSRSLLSIACRSASVTTFGRRVRGPFGLTIFHPNQGAMTFLAKISPKPSMTPFTNGRNMLMARDERRANARVLTGTLELKMRGVTAGGWSFVLDEGMARF